MLLRYDDCGESHVVLRRAVASEPTNTTPLAMRWYNDPGVAPFDIFAGEEAGEWFRFNAPPGTFAIRVRAESTEPLRAWMNGAPMRDCGNGRFEAERPAAGGGLIEGATPECRGPREVLVYQRAQDRLEDRTAQVALQGVAQQFGDGNAEGSAAADEVDANIHPLFRSEK